MTQRTFVSCGCSSVLSALGIAKSHVFARCVPAEVEDHPFDIDTMLFMDWRDDHLAHLPEVKARNDKLPTFLYAMPFSKNKVSTVVATYNTAVSVTRIPYLGTPSSSVSGNCSCSTSYLHFMCESTQGSKALA